MPATPFDKSSAAIALDQINLSTQYVVPETKIKFGKPVPLDMVPVIVSDENTFVSAVIDPKFDSRFSGDNGFIYRRLPLEGALSLASAASKAPIVYPTTIHELLVHVNALYGTQFMEEDIVDGVLLSVADVINLQCDPHNLAFTGNFQVDIAAPVYQFLISDPFLDNGFEEFVPLIQENLMDVVVDANLNGFDLEDL